MTSNKHCVLLPAAALAHGGAGRRRRRRGGERLRQEHRGGEDGQSARRGSQGRGSGRGARGRVSGGRVGAGAASRETPKLAWTATAAERISSRGGTSAVHGRACVELGDRKGSWASGTRGSAVLASRIARTGLHVMFCLCVVIGHARARREDCRRKWDMMRSIRTCDLLTADWVMETFWAMQTFWAQSVIWPERRLVRSCHTKMAHVSELRRSSNHRQVCPSAVLLHDG